MKVMAVFWRMVFDGVTVKLPPLRACGGPGRKRAQVSRHHVEWHGFDCGQHLWWLDPLQKF